MVGDALIHDSLYKDAYKNDIYDFSSMFEYFQDTIRDSDLLYYNQESIIGGNELGFSGYPLFNTPSYFAEAMINMGFNIVSRANNHTLDKGEMGLINSCNFWNKYPSVLTHGSACTSLERDNPRIMEMAGVKYTMLSYTLTTNGLVSPQDYYVNIYSDEKVLEDIEKIRNDVDILMVAMHWGDEYKKIPNSEQIRISEYLASLGVDIVIGSHPHVIQPLKWIGDTLVIYSLGNFVSGQSIKNEYNRRIGLVVNIDITKTTTDHETRVKLDNLNTNLVYTYSKGTKNYRVVPFSKLDNNMLYDYKSLKIKYDSIVKYYDKNINTN